MRERIRVPGVCGQVAGGRRETMSETPERRTCPRCGKPAGQFKDGGSGRFRYLVICGACAWSAGRAHQGRGGEAVERDEAGRSVKQIAQRTRTTVTTQIAHRIAAK